MRVVGGKVGPDGRLFAYIVWTVPGGPAEKGGLQQGDKVSGCCCCFFQSSLGFIISKCVVCIARVQWNIYRFRVMCFFVILVISLIVFIPSTKYEVTKRHLKFLDTSDGNYDIYVS